MASSKLTYGVSIVPLVLILTALAVVSNIPESDAFFLPNLFGGPALPGDLLSPELCERACRNHCLSGGFSGSANFSGCNSFCDCDYYVGPPVYYNYY